MKTGLSDMLDQLASGSLRVGVLFYGSLNSVDIVHMPANGNESISRIKTKIGQKQFRPNNVIQPSTLGMAFNEVEQICNASCRGIFIPRVIVVITSAEESVVNNLQIAQLSLYSRMTVVAVGVGSRVNMTALSLIASERLIYTISHRSYTALIINAKSIAALVSSIPPVLHYSNPSPAKYYSEDDLDLYNTIQYVITDQKDHVAIIEFSSDLCCNLDSDITVYVSTMEPFPTDDNTEETQSYTSERYNQMGYLRYYVYVNRYVQRLYISFIVRNQPQTLQYKIGAINYQSVISALCSPYCSNEGICTGPNSCICKPPWTGHRCETPVCTPQCLNGGSCITPNTCNCTLFWTGSQCEISLVPLCGALIDIQPNARWDPSGLTVAGGNGYGSGTQQLYNPTGLFFENDHQIVLVVDRSNERIVECKWGATNGQVVAGGNGAGSGTHQLNIPHDVIVDKETDSIIIADYNNKRVVRWPRRNSIRGETIISNIGCTGLTMDQNRFLYVTDYDKHEVRRFRPGESQGTIVAGGNGPGNRLDQLYNPYHVFVDRDYSIYVADCYNHRVMKWVKDARQGIVVAGGRGQGSGLSQLNYPIRVVVDQRATIYVSDHQNHRVVRWRKEATQGGVIIGGNGQGGQANQLNFPIGLSFDHQGNLYVADTGNHRVQKFALISNP